MLAGDVHVSDIEQLPAPRSEDPKLMIVSGTPPALGSILPPPTPPPSPASPTRTLPLTTIFGDWVRPSAGRSIVPLLI